MSQSLAKNLIHLVFGAKDRIPLIDDDIRSHLHEYAAGTLRVLDSPALLMNSVSDHVHVLFNLHKTKALAGVIMELKRSTSLWMKEQGSAYSDFYWQAGYGAFSVSQSSVGKVQQYIADQKAHHARRTFQSELRILLTRHEIEFDEVTCGIRDSPALTGQSRTCGHNPGRRSSTSWPRADFLQPYQADDKPIFTPTLQRWITTSRLTSAHNRHLS